MMSEMRNSVWFSNLSSSDIEHYEKNRISRAFFDSSHSLPCTACLGEFDPQIVNSCIRHPLLETPICSPCFLFYSDGAWTRDEDGYDKYCRCCGHGGELIICDVSSCFYAFCTSCLSRNLGNRVCETIKKSEFWSCLSCERSNLDKQRILFYSLYLYWSLLKKEKKTIQILSLTHLKSSAFLNRYNRVVFVEEKRWRKKLARKKDFKVCESTYKRLCQYLQNMKREIESIQTFLIRGIDKHGSFLENQKPEKSKNNNNHQRNSDSETVDNDGKYVENENETKYETIDTEAGKNYAEDEKIDSETGKIDAEAEKIDNVTEKIDTEDEKNDAEAEKIDNEPEKNDTKDEKTDTETQKIDTKDEKIDTEDEKIDTETDTQDEYELEKDDFLQDIKESRQRKRKKRFKMEKKTLGDKFKSEICEGQKETILRKNIQGSICASPKKDSYETIKESVLKSSNEEEEEEEEFESSNENEIRNSCLKVTSKVRSHLTERAVMTENEFKFDCKVQVEELSARVVKDLMTEGEIFVKDYSEFSKKSSTESFDKFAFHRLINLKNIKSKARDFYSDSDDDDGLSISGTKKLRSFSSLTSSKLLQGNSIEMESSNQDSEESGDEFTITSNETSPPPLTQNEIDKRIVLSSSTSDEAEDDVTSSSENEESEGRKNKRKTRFDSARKKKSRKEDLEEILIDEDSSEFSDYKIDKSRKRFKNVYSDSDSSVKSGSAKRKIRRSPEDSSFDEDEKSTEDSPLKTSKRKRIKKNKNSSDESEDEDGEGGGVGGGAGGRKNIHKVKKMAGSSKHVAEKEKERRKRMEEKQRLYNKEFSVKEGDELKELILDFDEESKTPLVQVASELATQLKPHQAEGIRFMWNSVFESKKDVENGVVPGGAILAHCMGLGKTLQTIGLVHTVMTQFKDKLSSTLVLCPVNTIKNWREEFDKWCKGSLEMDVYELSGEKDTGSRALRISYWTKEGGVLIMGYDMFRNLTNESNKRFKKKQRISILESLIDPGPDLVICDEGHILKNNKSALNACMTRIKTKRRIILTGTPLQNNLVEYYAMVNFVKPLLLGTFTEFKNRFVNPIQNGQHSDSTDRDVRIMKKRSFILNDLLKGCLQRLDYHVLTPYLQPKHEYVLCINLTVFQKKLYLYYLENFARAGQIGNEGKLEGGKKGGLFYDIQNLSRVWNHPYILYMAKEKNDLKRLFQENEEELNTFIVDDDDDDENDEEEESGNGSTSEDNSENESSNTRNTRNKNDGGELAKGLDETPSEVQGWWNQFLGPEDNLENIEHGSKMVLLMEILNECGLCGDKVLVFSQSLATLAMIEIFLQKASENQENILTTWIYGKNYFRLDGSTPPEVRKRQCNYFNKVSNIDMRLFLISTKAGGLGINLVAANRVIIFDASWNPAHDLQSIFRVYRFGQKKPVYIYRFLAKGTMEEKIYDRQVTKQSLSARVVDEQQIERHFSLNELSELYDFKSEDEERPIPKVPEDRLLAEILNKHPDKIWKFHDHDTLLENQVDENLTEEERKAAWEEFENEKKGFSNMDPKLLTLPLTSVNSELINPLQIHEAYRRTNPHLTNEQITHATRTYIMQLQSAITRKPVYDNNYYKQEMARAKMVEKNMYPSMFRSEATSLRGSTAANALANSSNSLQKYMAAQAKVQNFQRIQRLYQSIATPSSEIEEIVLDDGDESQPTEQ